MGQEIRCIARLGDTVSEGRALLETDELLFRGDFRLRIPFRGIRSLDAADGCLTVAFSDGTAIFELGPQAERWAERIRNPKTLVDKLGVKPGMRVSVLGVSDEVFLELLRGRTEDVSVGSPVEGSDLVLVQVETAEDLLRVGSLEVLIKRDGGIWVISPKGREDLTELDVLRAGRSAGLVDTKVARFSDTHTAHRFSIPKTRR